MPMPASSLPPRAIDDGAVRAAVVLLIRRRTRLALYVAVTGLGAATLSPLIKHVVDRLRPVVDTPVATAA